jgi:hypothetical protein
VGNAGFDVKLECVIMGVDVFLRHKAGVSGRFSQAAMAAVISTIWQITQTYLPCLFLKEDCDV